MPERAKAQAEKFKIANHYPHIDEMLAGAAFDLLVNLTDMQEHERLNRQAVEAGKHVWSEKPMANSLAAGQGLLRSREEEGRAALGRARRWCVSPQFAFMAKTLAAGKLGRVAAAHADYGHTGPDWSAFFYEKGGGSLPDLARLQPDHADRPARPGQGGHRHDQHRHPDAEGSGDKGEIKVVAEDNAMVLMDHGNGVISHVQSGFNYFNPHGHDGSKETAAHDHHRRHRPGSWGWSGTTGSRTAWTWPRRTQPKFKRHATDARDFVWQMGASLAAECLATGRTCSSRRSTPCTCWRSSRRPGVVRDRPAGPADVDLPWPVVR